MLAFLVYACCVVPTLAFNCFKIIYFALIFIDSFCPKNEFLSYRFLFVTLTTVS